MNEKKKIDHRRHYIMVLDTETANTIDNNGKVDMSNVLMYDCGFAVCDIHGTVYETRSFVNRDIFIGERELMRSAYYAHKIPQYCQEIREGKRVMSDTYGIRKEMLNLMKLYRINEVCAHNARFDTNALNTTLRYITKSKSRYWFPYGTEIWCSMLMARSVIHKMPTYRQFCEEWDLFTTNGKLSTTAENLYRYILDDPTYEEEHTGLEDVLIEKEILAKCYRQHKAMKKVLYSGEKDLTDKQLSDILISVIKRVGNLSHPLR